MTLLRDPSERVPLGERVSYENALQLIENGDFEGYELQSTTENSEAVNLPAKQLQIFWHDSLGKKPVIVRVVEERFQGPLAFSCSLCLDSGRAAKSCEHQWASFVLLWQVVTLEKEQILHPEQAQLSADLRRADELEDLRNQNSEFAGVTLDSVSLFFDEPALLKGDSLGSLLKLNFNKYKFQEVTKDKEILSPQLWNLPEVFRKKLTAYSEYYFNEVNKQNRLADILCYNFSNGMQISAKEILRHPLQKKVPGELLPQANLPSAVSVPRLLPTSLPWSLIQRNSNAFVSQNLAELEEIMQSLLDKVATQHRQRKLDLYLQTKSHPLRAMKVESIEFDPVNAVNWRVDFVERKELHAEFTLMSLCKSISSSKSSSKSSEEKPVRLHFYESFAVEPTAGILVVHPWCHEFNQLQEALSALDKNLWLTDRERPSFEVVGELEAKSILKYLRPRAFPVKITGESRTLNSHQSQIEIRLDETGNFYVQHEARVLGQKNLVRKGWTTKSVLYLQTLSQGLPFLLNAEAKDIATRVRSKRDWDLKLLKHLGILQYLFLEVLSFYFEGNLTCGAPVEKKENLFSALHSNIQKLLLAGSEAIFARDLPLTELCSKSVLACFEDFVNLTFKTLGDTEAFYSDQGEVIMEGVVEREFRLIFELLRKMALTSVGEVFKKSRTSFLSKVTKEDPDKDLELTTALFHFPTGESKIASSLQGSLESLQILIPHGFKIYFKDQAIQELQEDEFQVDFILQSGLASEGERKFFNWFELNPKFFLRGEEVDPDNFLSLSGNRNGGDSGVIEYKGKLFLVPQKQMPSLRRLEHFWLKLQKGKAETQKKKNGDTIKERSSAATYKLPRSQTLELLALRASGVGIRGDEEWQKLCHFYDNLGSVDRERKLSAATKSVLKPYQAAGVQWLEDLYRLRLGALLADDMGLGKTLQTLSFLDGLREKKELGQVLIVVPSSLIFNWQSEIEKFTPELSLTVFSGREADAIGRRLEAKEEMLVIITYGLLREHEEFINQYKWKILIFDEAQNLKNITTKRTSAARSLTAQFRICLTGTPMENHYGEFYSLVDILVPGSLGKIEDFRRQFVNSEMVTRVEMEDLQLKIKPLLLRRTKKEILDQLPVKQESKVSIAFEDQQKEIYRDIALSYNQKVQEAFEKSTAVQGEARVQLQMLTAILRLRQACSDPAALPNVRYEKMPPKLETLLDSLQEIVESGESALVFTQFLQTLEHTAKILQAANIPVFVLHGGVPTKQRQKILAEFDKMIGGAVLVMTLKTGGVGLNLTKASYVFHLEPWWNPSVENQATDRAHRIGQSKAVQVFKYIMYESLEEKIELLKDRKDRKFQALFSNTEKEVEVGAGSNALSKQDFDLLLGIVK